VTEAARGAEWAPAPSPLLPSNFRLKRRIAEGIPEESNGKRERNGWPHNEEGITRVQIKTKEKGRIAYWAMLLSAH
jgi:hypothetical protein